MAWICPPEAPAALRAHAKYMRPLCQEYKAAFLLGKEGAQHALERVVQGVARERALLPGREERGADAGEARDRLPDLHRHEGAACVPCLRPPGKVDRRGTPNGAKLICLARGGSEDGCVSGPHGPEIIHGRGI